MKLKDIFKENSKSFSFEFFPPKTQEGEKKLIETVHELKELAPTFVSVTYGAMGTTRENTLRIVSMIKNEIGMEAAAHLTCVGHSRDEIEKILYQLRDSGIENIVALRGDAPQGDKEFKPAVNGFRYASELVHFIKSHPDFENVFSLAVAGYPEGHIECESKTLDFEHFSHKVSQGADAVVTQLFFNNDDFYWFWEKCQGDGIEVPIIPGIMPISNGRQVKKFSEMCGASVPAIMLEKIEKYGDDTASIAQFGIDYATRQCEDLLQHGVPGLHFYTLNQSRSTMQIYHHLGLKTGS